MIIWSGWGILTLLLGGLGLLAGVMLAAAGVPFAIASIAGGAVAAAAIWLAGRKLNDPKRDRELVDPQTGQRVVLRQRHTLFWIPMQWWGIAALLIAAVLAFSGPLPERPARGRNAALAETTHLPALPGAWRAH